VQALSGRVGFPCRRNSFRRGAGFAGGKALLRGQVFRAERFGLRFRVIGLLPDREVA